MHGYFLYDGATFTPFSTEVDAYISQFPLYCGITLPDGNFAFGTKGGGLFILSREGKIQQMVTQAYGLRADFVYSLHLDTQGGLWAALENGLSRIEVPATFTSFTDKNGLQGAVSSILRHKDKMYATTSAGLFWSELASFIGRRSFTDSY
jgi:ligand-binding sensor domain-containing protein